MSFCEMCGKEANLVGIRTDGAELNVCPNCSKFGQIVKNPQAHTAYLKSRTFEENKGPEFKIVDDYSFLIKSVREEKGLNHEDFSKLINERESLLTKWETGVIKPGIETAKKLEKLLGIKLVEKEEIDLSDLKPAEISKKNKIGNDVLTLGDFIKIKQRK